MGYMNSNPPSNFYQSRPSSPNTPDDGSSAMTQSNPVWPTEFATPLPFSVDIAPEDAGTYFSMEQELRDLSSRVSKLDGLKAAMEGADKFSMNVALECDSVLKTDYFTKLYFSEGGRVQKHAIAMEEVSLGMAALIAAVSAAIAGLIVALMAALSGETKGAEGGGGGGPINPTTVKEKQKAAEELGHATVTGEAAAAANEAIYEAAKGNHGHKVATEDFRTGPKVGDHPGYAKPLNAFQMDHISTGEYSRYIQELLQSVLRINPMKTIGEARMAYRQLLESDRHPEEAAKDVDALKDKYYKLMADPRAAHKVMMDGLNKLEAKHRALESGDVKFPQDINHALKLFSAAITNPVITSYVNDRHDLLPLLERLKEEANQARSTFEAEQKKGDSHFSNQVGRTGRDVLKEMHGLLAVMLKTDVLFQRYWKSFDAVASYLSHVVSLSRWKVMLTLKDKGLDQHQVAQDSNIQQLDKVDKAINTFRQRAFWTKK